MVRVEMGAVTDYFRPVAGTTVCEMLVSASSHEASSDGVTWYTPPYYPTSASLDVLGGSDTDWQQAAGGSTDVRRFLSFWGSKSAGQTAGCCSLSATVEQTIAGTYSSEPFTMTFYFEDDATDNDNDDADEPTTTIRTSPATTVATPSTKLLPYVKSIATDINLTLAVAVAQLGDDAGLGTGFVSAVSDWVFSTAGLTTDDVDEIRVDRLVNEEDGDEVQIIRVQILIKESSGVERAHVCLNAHRTTTLASGGGAGGDEPIDIAVRTVDAVISRRMILRLFTGGGAPRLANLVGGLVGRRLVWAVPGSTGELMLLSGGVRVITTTSTATATTVSTTTATTITRTSSTGTSTTGTSTTGTSTTGTSTPLNCDGTPDPDETLCKVPSAQVLLDQGFVDAEAYATAKCGSVGATGLTARIRALCPALCKVCTTTTTTC
jgi:hypothetical protein